MAARNWAASPSMSSSASSSAEPVSIVNAPTRVAHTALGDVGYRTVGQGSPIVLITGYLASMDNWAPPFVDAVSAAPMPESMTSGRSG